MFLQTRKVNSHDKRFATEALSLNLAEMKFPGILWSDKFLEFKF